jgi:hypothetical protein
MAECITPKLNSAFEYCSTLPVSRQTMNAELADIRSDCRDTIDWEAIPACSKVGQVIPEAATRGGKRENFDAKRNLGVFRVVYDRAAANSTREQSRVEGLIWRKSITKEEGERIQQAHMANIHKMAADGVLISAGPFDDTPRTISGSLCLASIRWKRPRPLPQRIRLPPGIATP